MTMTMALKLAASRKKAKETRKSAAYWQHKLKVDLAMLEAQRRVSRPWAYGLDLMVQTNG